MGFLRGAQVCLWVTEESALPATCGMWHQNCETFNLLINFAFPEAFLSLEGIFLLPSAGLANQAAKPWKQLREYSLHDCCAASAGFPAYGSNFYQPLPAKAPNWVEYVVSDATSLSIRTENFKGNIFRIWKLSQGFYVKQNKRYHRFF